MCMCVHVHPRAIDTAINVLGVHDLSRLRPIALEGLRETLGVYQCDKRRTKTELEASAPS